MTNEEAIARIKNHKIVHKMNEPRAVYISEALDMAIKALEREPVKIGHWIFREIEDALRWYERDWYECDQCGATVVKEYKYCPNCGAKMEEWSEKE